MNSWPMDQGRIGAGMGDTSSPTPTLSISMNGGTGLASSAVVRPLGTSQSGEANRTDPALYEPSLKDLRAQENEEDRKDASYKWKTIENHSKNDKCMKEKNEPEKYVYQDFSFAVSVNPGATEMPKRSSAQTMSFPERLYDILCREDTRDIITWMPHGRSWIILKPKVFESTMLPRLYSSRCKHSSFIRQANGWGFRRITQGPDQNSYYHELFLRGMPHLCKRMKRPGTFKKLPSDPDDEPDFHSMPPLPHVRPPEHHSNRATIPSVTANTAEIAQQLHLEQQIAQQRRLLIESAVYNAITGNNNSAISAPHIQRMLIAQQRERDALLQGNANNNAALLSTLPMQQPSTQQVAAAELMATLPNAGRERLPNNDMRAAVLAASLRNSGRVGAHPLLPPSNILTSILRNAPAASAAPEQEGAAQLNRHAQTRRFSSPVISNATANASNAALLEQRSQPTAALGARRWTGIDPSAVLALQLEEAAKQAALEDIARRNENSGQQ